MTHHEANEGFGHSASAGGSVMRYAFYDRHGGGSPAPFDSRNISYGAGDAEENISYNRNAVKSASGSDILLSARQVHGDNVFFGSMLCGDAEANGYDALITDQKGVGLMIQQADCQAVLLHDPAAVSIAAVHCGWRGSVKNIIGKTISAMKRRCGTHPENLRAMISPSLGPCCAEFIHYREELPKSFHAFRTKKGYFDFWRISRLQLEEAGVREENIFVTGICTSCSIDYFSYRRACRTGNGVTGRQCSIISLNL